MAACSAALIFLLRSTFFSKNIRFSSCQPSASACVFCGKPVSLPDEFPASFPPPIMGFRLRPVRTLHTFLCATVVSTKWCPLLGCRIYQIHHAMERRTVSLIARIKRFSTNKLMNIFEFLILSFFSSCLKYFLLLRT